MNKIKIECTDKEWTDAVLYITDEFCGESATYYQFSKLCDIISSLFERTGPPPVRWRVGRKDLLYG
jgi:hypothetical protein